MALGYEGVAFLKAAIEVIPERKQPLSFQSQAEVARDSCHTEELGSLLGNPPICRRGLQSQEGDLASNVGSANVLTDRALQASPLPETGESHAKRKGESGLVHPNLKPVQLPSGQTAASRSNATGSDKGTATETPLLSDLKESHLGFDSMAPLHRNSSSVPEGSDFESCAGSPQACASWRFSVDGAGDAAWAGDTPRSASSSVFSERDRQVESLEVQLATKSGEIQRLADMCSGAELALAEREREAGHLAALAQNLEEQIDAKNEVVDLSQELIGSLEERLVALEMQREALEGRVGEYEKVVLEMQGELGARGKELQGLRKEKLAVVRQSEELAERVKSLEGQVREKSEANGVLETRLEAAERAAAGRVGALTEKLNLLQARLAQNAQALTVAEGVICGLKQQLQEREDALKESKAECELVLAAGRAEYEKALQFQAELLRVADVRLDFLESEVVKKDGNLEAVGVHVADLTRQLAERERECEQAHAGVNRLQAQLKDSQAETGTLRQALAQERAARSAAEAKLEARVSELERKDALIAELTAKLAERAINHGECLTVERRGRLEVTSPESSWGESAVETAEQPEEDTGSSAEFGPADTAEAESLANSLESCVVSSLFTMDKRDGLTGGDLSREKRSGGAEDEDKRGANSGSAKLGSEPDAIAKLAAGIEAAVGSTGDLGFASTGFADPAKCNPSVGRETCSESLTSGLLKALRQIVSRRCSKDTEIGAASSRGLKVLLTI